MLAQPQGANVLALASQMPPNLRLGTSSWSFPGWNGLVYGAEYDAPTLAKHGLEGYSRHPLLRTVSLDRAFYRPLTSAQYAQFAKQVGQATTAAETSPSFRFVVKAPASICDATVRDAQGRSTGLNPTFLSPELAWLEALQSAAHGLGDSLGALVFQLSPLPAHWLDDLRPAIEMLERMLAHLQAMRSDWAAHSPNAVLAVEVRDTAWIAADQFGPQFAQALKRQNASYCLGLHAKMPDINGQLPMLRALWPGPLVARWSLHSRHGRFGYAAAKNQYEPFNQLVDPDPITRDGLAKVIAATARAGHQVLVTINNKAEGSAPKSVEALAEAVLAA